jgi:cytochrome c-type biogenesis protein CcmH/NrfG
VSQKKKTAYRMAPATNGTRQGATLPKGTYRKVAPRRREDPSRRMVAIGILAVAMVLAMGVILLSFEQGRGGSGSASQPRASGPSLDATVGPLMQRVSKDPTDVLALIELGNTFYDAERWTDAIPWYEKAVELAPKNTDVRTDLGTAYFYSGNNDKAKEHWFKTLEVEPNKVQTHYNLGILYSQSTPPDTEAAAQEWETVIKISPNSEQGRQADQKLKAMGRR